MIWLSTEVYAYIFPQLRTEALNLHGPAGPGPGPGPEGGGTGMVEGIDRYGSAIYSTYTEDKTHCNCKLK